MWRKILSYKEFCIKRKKVLRMGKLAKCKVHFLSNLYQEFQTLDKLEIRGFFSFKVSKLMKTIRLRQAVIARKMSFVSMRTINISEIRCIKQTTSEGPDQLEN